MNTQKEKAKYDKIISKDKDTINKIVKESMKEIGRILQK